MMLTIFLLLFPQAGNLEEALDQARVQAEGQNYRGAVAILEEAGAADANDAKARTMLGIYMLRRAEQQIASGQLQGLEINDAFLQAGYVLEEAAGMDGAPPAAYENWSEALLNGGDKQNALRAAEAGIEAHPQAAPVLMQRGRVLVAMANDSIDEEKKVELFDAAVAAYREAADAAETAAPLVKLGETTILAAFAASDPAKPDQVGQQAAQARKQAARAWKEALKRERDAVDLSAMCQWLHGEAVPLLEDLDASNGKDATMAWYMGFAEYNGQPRDWAEVRKHFERALALQPDMHNCHFFLAQGAFEEGARLQAAEETQRAESAYQYAAEHWGDYLALAGSVHRNQVLAAADRGQSAIDQLKWIAGKATMAGRFEAAIQISKWITETHPDDVEAWNNLAFLYRDSGQPEKSLAAYARTAELAPEDPQVLNDWAVIYHYYLKTEDAKAIALYEQAIELAEEILADPAGLSSEDRQRIQIGLRDARNNLRKLEAGNRRNG